ncbi:MAG: cell division protein ZapB [Treponema sp.]|nr:cell division protein ZapB [Treponema sp.]
MITLDQVLLLEQKVESAVAKIQQLQAENAALRNRCSELTNALSSKSEQLSSLESEQNQIESGLLKSLNRLSSIENIILNLADSNNSNIPTKQINVTQENQFSSNVQNNLTVENQSVSNIQQTFAEDNQDSSNTQIEFEEEKTESNVQQTTQNTFGDFSYNNEPEQKEEISPLTQNDITFDSMDDVYQDEYEDEDNGDFQDNLGFDIF